MTDRERSLEKARQICEQIEALDIQDRCEEFVAAERIIADAPLEAEARGNVGYQLLRSTVTRNLTAIPMQ